MSIQPTFTPRKPTWRGNTSSSDLNSNFEEIIYDLNIAFNEVSLMVVELNSLESRIRHEVSALNNRINSVSGVMLAHDQAAGYKVVHEDFYLSDNIVYPESLAAEDRCTIYTEFGVATLPVSNSFSKLYTTDISNNIIYTMPDMVATVTPLDENGSITISQSNPLRAFDGIDSNVWERKVKFERDYIKSAITCRIDLTMPFVNNPYVNCLFIKPYPEGTLDVQSITYNTLSSQNIVLPSFPAGGENGCKATLYSFNNIQPASFKFNLRQRTNILEDNYKTFVYGMREIGIERIEYKSNGKVGIKFTLPEYEYGLFKTITSLSTYPEYDNLQYKLSLFPTEDMFNANTPVWTSNSSSIIPTSTLNIQLYTTDSIWVLVELTQESSSTNSPLLRSITMTYTTYV